MADVKYEQELKAYIHIGKRYIRKKDILALLMILFALALAAVAFLLPLLRNLSESETLFVNSEKLKNFSGYGRIYDLDKSLLYEGGIVNGMPDGLGKAYLQDGSVLYDGGFSETQFSEYGILYGVNGSPLYEGEFQNNLYHGQGTLFYDNGSTHYIGSYAYGQKYGFGQLFSSDGILLYEGYFSQNQYHGYGTLFNPAQNIVYEGEFHQGEYHGQGTAYNKSGRLLYSGAYTHGKKNGFGTLYSEDGNMLFNGLFLMDNIDYLSLLGRHYSDTLTMFGSRRYISRTELPIPATESSIAEEQVEEQYYCEGYAQIEAALVFSVKDNEPDYVEWVIIWDGAGEVSGEGYIGVVPPWMQMFQKNEACPISAYIYGQEVLDIKTPGDFEVILWRDISGGGNLWYSAGKRTETSSGGK